MLSFGTSQPKLLDYIYIFMLYWELFCDLNVPFLNKCSSSMQMDEQEVRLIG